MEEIIMDLKNDEELSKPINKILVMWSKIVSGVRKDRIKVLLNSSVLEILDFFGFKDISYYSSYGIVANKGGYRYYHLGIEIQDDLRNVLNKKKISLCVKYSSREKL